MANTFNNNNVETINVRVEYESTPIRHIAIQCPGCSKWFHGYDLIDKGMWLSYDYQIETTTYTCPVCGKTFGFKHDSSSFSYYGAPKIEYNIKEVSSAEECYKDCLNKKEVWE